MRNKDKTKDQLIKTIMELRQHIGELKESGNVKLSKNI
jgi:hypothetical protein